MATLLGVIRISLGVLFVMTGVMKYAVPRLRAAWSGQLRQARLPFYGPTFWLLPLAEIAVGTALILGVAPRLAAVAVILMMLGATYVHVVVDDPSVFPLQPDQPIIPIAVIVLAVVILIGGGGSWTVAG